MQPLLLGRQGPYMEVNKKSSLLVFARWTIWLLMATALASLAQLAVFGVPEINDVVLFALGYFWQLLVLAAAVGVSVWLYKANDAAHSRDGKPMRFNPGLAAVSLWIPLLNLILPYLVVRELWRGASVGEADEVAVPLHVHMWGGLWIVVWLLWGVAELTVFLQREVGVPGLARLSFVSALAFSITYIAVAILTAIIVSTITAALLKGQDKASGGGNAVGSH